MVVEKAFAYITHRGRLLVFRHPESPEAGIQVPAGTLEAGESPRQGALREAREETGLDGLVVEAALGSADFDMSPFGKHEIHRRHFFHLSVRGDPPATWRHAERFRSDGGTPTPFEFFWVTISPTPDLIAGHAALLARLDATPIRVVAFDLDGVVIPSEPSFAFFESEYGITREQFRAFFMSDYVEPMLGRRDLLEVLPPVLRTWGWRESPERFVEVWTDSCAALDAGAVEVVRALQRQDITCCVASNQDNRRGAYLDAHPPLCDLFPDRFFSAMIGVAKPDPAYFRHIETALGASPGEILFFDDHEANVDAALQAGWRAAHVPSPAALPAVAREHFPGIV